MSPFRKRLIRAVYKMLDRDGQGYPTVGDIRACYHILPSRTITIRGKNFHRATLDELFQYFFNTNDLFRLSNSRGVSWDTFYEYYQCISLAIDSEELFELVIRHSWSVFNDLFEEKPMTDDNESIFTREQSVVFERMISSTSSLQRDLSTSIDSTTTAEEAGALSPIPSASKSSEVVPESRSYDFINLVTKSTSIDIESTEIASNSFDLHSPTSKKPPRHPTGISRSPTFKRTVSRVVGIVHSDSTEETVLIEEGDSRLNTDSVSKELNSRGINDIKFLRF